MKWPAAAAAWDQRLPHKKRAAYHLKLFGASKLSDVQNKYYDSLMWGIWTRFKHQGFVFTPSCLLYMMHWSVFQVWPSDTHLHIWVCVSPACRNEGEVCSGVGGEVARAVQWAGTWQTEHSGKHKGIKGQHSKQKRCWTLIICSFLFSSATDQVIHSVMI